MLDATTFCSSILQKHCNNEDPCSVPLRTLLLGIMNVICWTAVGQFPDTLQHSSLMQLGTHVGTASVFMVADTLLHRRIGKKVEAALHVSISSLLAWMFPADKNYGRQAEGALRAMAGLLTANGLALLKSRARTQQGHQIGRLLSPKQRSVFWPDSFPDYGVRDKRVAIDELVHLQLVAVRAPNMGLDCYGSDVADAAVLYQWLGPSRYVGVASVQRRSRPGLPGPAQRFWEHCLLRSRPALKGSQLRKYKLFRRAPVCQQGFLICRCGPSAMMFAAEQLEIRCHRPPGNTTKRKKLKCNNLARSRPPRSGRGYVPHHVRQGTFEGGFAAVQFDKAKARVLDALHFNSLRLEHQDAVKSLQLDFRSAYRHFQQIWLASSGVFGPLDIRSPKHWRLALLYMSTFTCSLHWRSLDKHWGSSCAALLLWKRAKMWLGQRRRAIFQQKVDSLLHSRRLPSTRGATIKVPRPCFVPAVKKAIRTAVSQHPHWDPLLRQHVLQSTRIVLGKEITFADKQNCGARSQDFDWGSLAQCDDSTLADAICGQGCSRVECNWKVPLQPTPQADIAAVKRSLAEWAKKFAWPGTHKQVCGKAAAKLRCSRKWQELHATWQNQRARYLAHTCQFSGPGLIICPDDKIKQYKWKVPVQSYFLMMAWFVCVSTSWHATSITPTEANAWCLTVLLTFVPRALHRHLGLRPGRWVLPYCYTSIKDKCFQGEGSSRSCSKPHHSCMRRIVSYCKWPCRGVWRQASRALAFLVKHTIFSDEVWGLKDARADMEKKLDRLIAPRRAGFCDRCGGHCHPLQGITADAGQFFEAVSSYSACDNLGSILRLAKQNGFSAVTVAGRRTVFFGGCIYRSFQACRVFHFNDLFWLFAAAVSMKYCHTGTKVWEFSGLPIGGLLSKMAASCVLGWQEHDWRQDADRRHGERFHWPDRLWNHMVARGRYVDDILWVSRALCSDCLTAAIPVVYTVPFDVQTMSADGKLTWLDFEISLPEMRWSVRKKPFVPRLPWAVSQRYAFSIISGRVSRWQEMKLLPEDFAEALVDIFAAFRLAGWQKKHLRKAVFRVAQRKAGVLEGLIVHIFHACFPPLQ